MENIKEMLALAKSALMHSYSPYGNYHVGAVLSTKAGQLYTGCNIENAGIQSICAERVAFVKALSEGEKEFSSILVIGKPTNTSILQLTTPCGYCRQFMNEFVTPDFKIYVCDSLENFQTYTLEALLPHRFILTEEK